MNVSVKNAIYYTLLITIFLGSLGFPPLETRAESSFKGVQIRTQEEIKHYFDTHYFDIYKKTVLDIEPDISAGYEGQISRESKKETLNALNFIRYIAGLEEVKESDEYHSLVQTGASLLDSSNMLSHKPSKPNRMKEEMYEKGLKATSRSNIARNYESLSHAIIDGWIDDTLAHKVSELAHRRWILDPDMEYTGFGFSGAFSSMFIFDGYRSNHYSADYIPWPAVNTPSQYFSGNWSISLNPNIYGFSSEIIVYIQDLDTEHTIRYSAMDTKDFLYSYTPDGSFGRGNAIIFEPLLSTDVGKRYAVRITGLKSKSGRNLTDIRYEVNFFNLHNPSDSSSIRLAQNQRDYDIIDASQENPNKTIPDLDNDYPIATESSATNSNATDSDALKPTKENKKEKGILANDYDASIEEEDRNVEKEYNNQNHKDKDTSTISRVKRIDTNFYPSYDSPGNPNKTKKGEWIQDSSGKWKFKDLQGNFLINCWAKIYNYYANAKQSNYDWFYFGEDGYMVTGWLITQDGKKYYLNPVSDGTQGKMLTGWHWIQEGDFYKYYYFHQYDDEKQGHLYQNTVVDGYTVGEDGAWKVRGVVQKK